MFKCPECKGKTKTCQTRHDDPNVVVRKCKCLNCGKLFFTEETFKRWTEESIRQQVEKKLEQQEREDAELSKRLQQGGLHNFVKSFVDNEKAKENVKIKLSGTRSDDADEVMARMVVTSAPIKWDEIDTSFDPTGSTFSGGQ